MQPSLPISRRPHHPSPPTRQMSGLALTAQCFEDVHGDLSVSVCGRDPFWKWGEVALPLIDSRSQLP